VEVKIYLCIISIENLRSRLLKVNPAREALLPASNGMKTPRRVIEAALAVTRAIGSPLSIVIHSIIFAASFLAVTERYIDFERMLLLLTTIVSLEAIYLSLFIQMTINYTTESIQEVGEDIEELQEDVGEIQEDVGEIQEDVGELQEDVEEITEEEEGPEDPDKVTLAAIQSDLRRLLADVEKLKNSHNHGSSQNSANKQQ